MSISPTRISLLFFFVNLCVYMLWTIGDILCIHLTWTTGDVHYNTNELHVHVPSKQSLCLLFNYGMNGSRLHVCESYKSISLTHISLFFFFVNLCVYVSWTIGDILCIHLTWTIGDVHYSTYELHVTWCTDVPSNQLGLHHESSSIIKFILFN